MGDYIVESLIMAVNGIIIVLLLNRNWFARQHLKNDLKLKEMDYKFKIDKRRIKTKMPKSVDNPLDALGGLTKYLPMLQSLDGDQIQDLMAIFLGGDEEVEPSGILEQVINKVPPEVIQGFIDGFIKKDKNTAEPISQV